MDSTWAHIHRSRLKRAVLIIVGVSLAVYIGVNMYEPPTCFDNKQNQDEIGTDCGGPCALLCNTQIDATPLMWSRAFEVSPGVWSVFAYLNNPNFSAHAPEAPYRFELYDKFGTLLTESTGTTHITSDSVLPVFGGNVTVENAEPYRVVFKWDGPRMWYKNERTYDVSIEERSKVRKTGTGSEVTAVLHNNEPIPLAEVEVVVIVYGTDKNAIAVSSTLVDYIGPRAKRNLTFSWPTTLSGTPERLEFVARVPAAKQ